MTFAPSVDRDRALNHPIAPMVVEVERGRLRFFARVIGLTDPVHFDLDAARAAGHPDLVAPPTFLSNSLELELPDPLGWLAEVGGDLTTTTHAEQTFTYHALAYGGDRLVFQRRIVDVYSKKDGALEFVVKRTDILRSEQLIAEVDSTIVLRRKVKS